MSIPKEPRQKMINMMYLVLTALLALNVSTEVLNAFMTVNNSLQKSNGVVDEKNNLTYNAFKREKADQQTAALAKIWAPPAESVQNYSTALSNYIQSLKDNLIDESGGKMVDGKKEFNIGDLDAATRMFDTKGEGKVLYNKLIQYRKDLLATLDPANFPDQSDTIKAELKRAIAEFSHRLPLDTRIPVSETGEATSGDSAKDWTIRYFHMTPTIAALTILSKFQSDVKGSESQVIDFLHKQIGEVKVVFNKFQVLAQANANYLMPGDDLIVTAGVGAFSDAARPDVFVNGTKYEVGPDGTASFKTKAEGSGDKTIMVDVSFTKPDGSKETKHMPVKYTVGTPSGASIFLEKMNVMYVKEDNPVTISGGSVGAEKVHVSFTNGDITHVSGDEYNVVPTTPGEGKIIVTANGKPKEFKMRVKYLPNPTGFIGTHTGGVVSSAEFKAIGGVLAKLEGSEFQSSFVVVGYTLAGLGGNIPQYVEVSNNGPRWTGQAEALVTRASPGAHIFITHLQVKGKDGRVRELPDMSFMLK
jgi:gliding motility-associated protein GldM